MNDWVIFFADEDSNAEVEYNWTRIDVATAKLAELQGAERNSELPDDAIDICIQELEHAISMALAHGLSVRAIGDRTNLSQSDVARVRDTGRLYER